MLYPGKDLQESCRCCFGDFIPGKQIHGTNIGYLTGCVKLYTGVDVIQTNSFIRAVLQGSCHGQLVLGHLDFDYVGVSHHSGSRVAAHAWGALVGVEPRGRRVLPPLRYLAGCLRRQNVQNLI